MCVCCVCMCVVCVGVCGVCVCECGVCVCVCVWVCGVYVCGVCVCVNVCVCVVGVCVCGVCVCVWVRGVCVCVCVYKIIYALKDSITATEPLFMKPTLHGQLLAKNSYTTFLKNLTNRLAAITKSPTDGRWWSPHRAFFIRTVLRLGETLYFC